MQWSQNFNLYVRRKKSKYFVAEKSHFQFFFRILSQLVPIFEQKLRAVLSESVVALPEDLFEGKVILTKKFCFLNNQLEKESWSSCFSTCVTFASLVLIVKFCGEKKHLSEISAISFLSECERIFWTFGKKVQSSSEKISWELRKLLSFLLKRLLEKLTFLERKQLQLNYQTWARKFKNSVEPFFQQFCRKTIPIFRRNLWG